MSLESRIKEQDFGLYKIRKKDRRNYKSQILKLEKERKYEKVW
jgi:hypothetical protein